MKKILLPTDFSENAYKSICYGLRLFMDEECVFFIFNVHGPSALYMGDSSFISGTMAGQVEEVLRQQAEKGLEEVKQRIDKEFQNPKHSFELVAKFNFFLEGVNEMVKEEKIDLILMGTKGASGFKEMIMGSNAGHVVNKVNCPVLVVPEDAACEIPHNVGFVTDYDVSFEYREIGVMIDIARMWRSKVHILHIKTHKDDPDEKQQNNRRILEDMLEGVDHKFYQLSNVDIETGVNCFVELLGIDLVGMIARSRKFIERLLFIPKVVTYSYHTHTPFLVMKEQ